MKYFNKIAGICFLLLLVFTFSCKKVLVEDNKSNITPGIFSTPLGLQAGLSAAYSNLRYIFGQEAGLYITESGVDEIRRGDGASTQMFFYNIQTTEGNTQALWDQAYISINTLNGVIEKGPDAALPASVKDVLVGEAKFLRAWYYFLLVQTFGDVSLNLTFNTSPSVSASRQPIADVYNAIVSDLTDASAVLPNVPLQSKGHASKAAAQMLLAKVYLTRGWSSAAVASDFQNAYTTANNLITNKATYGLDLWQDYADVHKEGNEYGKEIIWVLDRNTDPKAAETNYSGGASGSPNGGNKENRSCFYHRPNYPGVQLNVNAGITGAPVANYNVMDRDIANGRPWLRVRPSNYAYNVAFGERVNDSRYDNTFQTVWIFNRSATVTTSRGTLIKDVDTAIWMPGYEVTEAQRLAFKGVILSPSQYTGTIYPSMKKYDDKTRLVVNDPSDRPFIMFKFSELYLIAAEAAFKGGATINDAVNMLNALRQRAAYRATNSAAQNAAAVLVQTITAASVNIDFILDEYCRELYGEWRRWYDLARTKTLAARVAAYNADAATGFASPKHLLRPIPQSQIDLVTEGPAYPQNPGY
jgi:hypothetical protein